MSIKSWKIPKTDKLQAQMLSQSAQIPPFLAELLVNRGYTMKNQLSDFLSDEGILDDPFDLCDMDIAVDRIKRALDNREKIAVYGDYDCDGVTSTAILTSYLQTIGADVIYYIPSRDTEGYGLNTSAIELLGSKGINLIITVDNGISAIDEVSYANNLGIDVIITDHHQVPKVLPDALAVINPHRKDCRSAFKELAGVGVAFKLITALEGGEYEYTLEQYADLVAIGTIGDVVSLVEENRTIVKYGLDMLKLTDNIGLCALMDIAGIKREKLKAESIAFGICPRINAAGRMADASLAVELLLCDDTAKAIKLAQEINDLNIKRKDIEETTLEDIDKIIFKNPECLNDRVLTFVGKDWHHGVIGIASSRLVEKYGKPNILLSETDGVLRGSARSVENFLLYNALSACSEHLKQFGGHTMAAGMTLDKEDFNAFKKSLDLYTDTYYKVMPQYTYQVDKIIEKNELTIENIKSLSILEPFGAGNPEPIFLIKGARITDILPVSENKHTRVRINFNGLEFGAIQFNTPTESFSFNIGNTIDILCNISVNPYNNKEYLSLVIKDIHLTGFDQYKFFNAKTYYEMYSRSEHLDENIINKAVPNRDKTAVVYKYLMKSKGYNGNIDLLYNSFIKDGINYFQFRLILDILSDVKLITVSPMLDEIKLLKVDSKVDLNSAETFNKLKRCAEKI